MLSNNPAPFFLLPSALPSILPEALDDEGLTTTTDDDDGDVDDEVAELGL